MAYMHYRILGGEEKHTHYLVWLWTCSCRGLGMPISAQPDKGRVYHVYTQSFLNCQRSNFFVMRYTAKCRTRPSVTQHYQPIFGQKEPSPPYMYTTHVHHGIYAYTYCYLLDVTKNWSVHGSVSKHSLLAHTVLKWSMKLTPNNVATLPSHASILPYRARAVLPMGYTYTCLHAHVLV